MNFIFPDLMQRGGWLMWPILLCSVIALGFFFERLFRLRGKLVVPRELVQKVDALIVEGQLEEARAWCETGSSAMARIYMAALGVAGQSRATVKEVVLEAGRREAVDLERHLPVLSMVASIAPLLGLLGTVSGMITTFNQISYYGVGNPGSLAGGISEALLTTAAGLSVAIPTLVGHRFIAGRADRLIESLEERSMVLVEALKGGGE